METRHSTAETKSGAPRRGRPRNADTDRAILAAAAQLLLSGGYARLSMDAVAAGSKVSKPTLYLRWPSKAALVADAVVAELSVRTAPSAPGPLPDSGDITRDLHEWFQGFVAVSSDPDNATLIRALVVAVIECPDDAEVLIDQLTEQRRQSLIERLHRAVAAGQIRPDVDLDAAADLMLGSILPRVLIGRTDGMRQRAHELMEIILTGLLSAGLRPDPRRDATQPIAGPDIDDRSAPTATPAKHLPQFRSPRG